MGWLRAAVLAVVVVPSAAAAGPAASPWASTGQSQVRLVSAVRAVGQRGTLDLGVHIRLEPGWKTYWRSPGDAGFPTVLDWQGSVNVGRAELRWPVPQRFTLFGLETLGYVDEVVLPVVVSLVRPGEAVSLRVDVDYAICKDICVPHEATLALELPAGVAVATAFKPLIDVYASRVPARGASRELAIEGVAVTGPLSAQALEVRARSARPFVAPDLLVEGPAGVYFGRPQARLGEGGLSARIRVPVAAGKRPRPLAGERLTLTLVDGARALEREAVAQSAE